MEWTGIRKNAGRTVTGRVDEWIMEWTGIRKNAGRMVIKRVDEWTMHGNQKKNWQDGDKTGG